MESNKEIKSIKSLIKYLEANEKESIQELKNDNELSIYEAFKFSTVEVIEKYCNEKIILSNIDKKYLHDNIYGEYFLKSYDYIKYVLLVDYIEMVLIQKYKNSFSYYKKEIIEKNKINYCSI